MVRIPTLSAAAQWVNPSRVLYWVASGTGSSIYLEENRRIDTNLSPDRIAYLFEKAAEIGWSQIQDKPDVFPPEGHAHDERYYTESEIDSSLQSLSDQIAAVDSDKAPLVDPIFTNNVEVAETLTAKRFRFSESSWDDIRIIPSAFDFAGVNDPTNVPLTIGGMTFRLWEFALNDEAFAIVQMPHEYKKGTVLRPHIHWTPGSRGNEEAGKAVGWKADISHAIFGQPFSNYQTVDLTHTLPADTVDNVHRIGPSADYTVPADFGESGMLLIRIYRNSVGDTWVGTGTGNLPLLLEFDIHYEIEKLGSDTEIPT